MVDYHKVTGDNPDPDFKGSMMIRDTGTYVEFWIRAGSVNTYHSAMPFGWTVNGSTGTAKKTYPTGKKWIFLKKWNVTTSQDVTFRLFETNTEGLGGPTTFTQHINRASVPNRPSRPVISQIGQHQAAVVFNDGYHNGAPILERRIGYGTKSGSPTVLVPSDGSTMVTGFKSGTTYYVWAQNRNSQGWSSWSLRASFMTLGAARIRVGGVWKNAIPYVRIGGIWKAAKPWGKKDGKWIESK